MTQRWKVVVQHGSTRLNVPMLKQGCLRLNSMRSDGTCARKDPTRLRSPSGRFIARERSKEASRRCRKVTTATAKQIDIALAVEIAAGRITTDDDFPTVAKVRRLVHGSAGLPGGAFGLLPEQADVIEEMWNGAQMWLEWSPAETEHTEPLESQQYRRADLELADSGLAATSEAEVDRVR